MSEHPGFERALQLRLLRIAGQIRGVRKMMKEERHGLDIACQIQAIQGALHRVNMELLSAHIRGGARAWLEQGDRAALVTCTEQALAAMSLMQRSPSDIGERQAPSPLCQQSPCCSRRPSQSIRSTEK